MAPSPHTADTPDGRSAALAGRQAGCLSRAQALEMGISDSMIRHRLRAARWARLHPGVYRIEGCPASWDQDVWAAVLAVGPAAAVTHETALLLHGLPDSFVPRHPVTLTVPNGRHHRIRGAAVHQVGDLRPHHLTSVAGLSVARVERAVVDIGATTRSAGRIGDVLDRLVADRRTTITKVATCLAELARRGKPGVVLLGSVLDERGPGYVPPSGRLEAALFDALSRAGLPEPIRQYPLPGRGAVEGLVDAAYPDARLLLEADGRRWHARNRDMAHDRRRDAEASRVGWLTLRFLYEQLMTAADDVAATVVETRAVRLRQLRGDAAA